MEISRLLVITSLLVAATVVKAEVNIYRYKARGLEVRTGSGSDSADGGQQRVAVDGYLLIEAKPGPSSPILIQIRDRTYSITELEQVELTKKTSTNGKCFVMAGANIALLGPAIGVTPTTLGGYTAWQRKAADGMASSGYAKITLIYDSKLTSIVNLTKTDRKELYRLLQNDELDDGVVQALGLDGFSRVSGDQMSDVMVDVAFIVNRANHSGEQTSDTITDFEARVLQIAGSSTTSSGKKFGSGGGWPNWCKDWEKDKDNCQGWDFDLDKYLDWGDKHRDKCKWPPVLHRIEGGDIVGDIVPPHWKSDLQIVEGSVGNPELAANSVTGDKVMDGTLSDVDVSSTAAISWSKVSKTGSSLSDLETRSASDLSSGTLSNSRLAIGHGNGIDADSVDGIQGASIVQASRTVNGHPLSADVTVTKADVGLGNVTNDAQLKTNSNLADLADKTASRLNLGLGDLATLSHDNIPYDLTVHGKVDTKGLQLEDTATLNHSVNFKQSVERKKPSFGDSTPGNTVRLDNQSGSLVVNSVTVGATADVKISGKIYAETANGGQGIELAKSDLSNVVLNASTAQNLVYHSNSVGNDNGWRKVMNADINDGTISPLKNSIWPVDDWNNAVNPGCYYGISSSDSNGTANSPFTSDKVILDSGWVIGGTNALHNDSKHRYVKQFVTNLNKDEADGTIYYREGHQEDGPDSTIFWRWENWVPLNSNIDTNRLFDAGDAASATLLRKLSLNTPGQAQGETSILSMLSTFQNIPGDNGPRRTADIMAGYNGGAWGTEYLSLCVGRSNDAFIPTKEVMRLNASGASITGNCAVTNDITSHGRLVPTLPSDGNSANVLHGDGSWSPSTGGMVIHDINGSYHSGAVDEVHIANKAVSAGKINTTNDPGSNLVLGYNAGNMVWVPKAEGGGDVMLGGDITGGFVELATWKDLSVKKLSSSKVTLNTPPTGGWSSGNYLVPSTAACDARFSQIGHEHPGIIRQNIMYLKNSPSNNVTINASHFGKTIIVYNTQPTADGVVTIIFPSALATPGNVGQTVRIVGMARHDSAFDSNALVVTTDTVFLNSFDSTYDVSTFKTNNGDGGFPPTLEVTVLQGPSLLPSFRWAVANIDKAGWQKFK